MPRGLPLARLAVRLALVLVCVGSARSASAAELQLEWHAPPECPDRAELASRVNRLLGDSMQSNLRAVTDVTRTPHGYRARLRTYSAAQSGERVLEQASCELLVDGVAVVIALAVAPARDVSRKNETAAVSVAASAHASALIGTLPRPAFGVGAAVALETLSLRFELRGTYHVPQSATLTGTELGARWSAMSLGARGCWVPRLAAVELGPCIGADAHYVSATGSGGEVTLSGHGISWGLAAGAFGRVRLTKLLGIVLIAEAAVPIARLRFVFADAGVLYRAAPVAAQLLIAVEVRF
jgi:hypothetical protein